MTTYCTCTHAVCIVLLLLCAPVSTLMVLNMTPHTIYVTNDNNISMPLRSKGHLRVHAATPTYAPPIVVDGVGLVRVDRPSREGASLGGWDSMLLGPGIDGIIVVPVVAEHMCALAIDFGFVVYAQSTTASLVRHCPW